MRDEMTTLCCGTMMGSMPSDSDVLAVLQRNEERTRGKPCWRPDPIELDYTFRLEEFAEDLEYIVAPHIIKSYLEGDQEALQKHCGDACFNTVNAGIKERKKLQMTLDTAILSGPREVELKGAKLMEQGAPCFIWTFNMQQVNCLRDAEGEIIEGAVDDIRTVCYAMAVTRHPQLDKLDLEYPWQVSELAILWNQPCF
eukprot:symbB.v1.2.018039.t1/scaffold1424.1/size119625/4